MFWMLGFLFFAFDAVAILLLVGCWQHTRINGFLMLAGSYALGILARWLSPLVYRFAEGEQFESVTVVVQLGYVAIAALALAGIWDIYRRLKAGLSSAAPTA
jgi:hypothetical protein